MAKKYHYVYLTYHLDWSERVKRGKKSFYIGIRTSSVPPEKDVSYLGSGAILRSLGRDYRKNFGKLILAQCSSIEEASALEEWYVDEDWVKDSTTYNLRLGGHKGKHTEASRKIISEKTSGRLLKTWSLVSADERKKLLRHLRTEDIIDRASQTRRKTAETEESQTKYKKAASLRWSDPDYRTRNTLEYLRTDEVRRKISESVSKSLRDLVCPNCSRVGRGPWMYQKHFDKCRHFGCRVRT